MGDERKNQDTAAQLMRLQSEIGAINTQIKWMQTRGGFTDAKTHSVRAQRAEDRLDKLEIQLSAALDVIAFMTELLGEHLKDRHNANLDRDDDIDVSRWRRIRQRLREMADKLGLTAKKRALHEVRRSENRLQPATA